MNTLITNKYAFVSWGLFSILAIIMISSCDDPEPTDSTNDLIVTKTDIPLDTIRGAYGTQEGFGQVLWGKLYGTGNSEYISSILETSDHGFITAGHTRRKDNTADDVWIMKLDAGLNVTWSKYFTDGANEYAYAVIETTDNGFVFAGDVDYATLVDDLGQSINYQFDAYIAKLDQKGKSVWKKCYGGDDYDRANDIVQAEDGGFIVAGHTQSYGAKYTPGPNAKKDIWIFKLNAEGEMEWELLYGEEDGTDGMYSITRSNDGGYVSAGFTESYGAGGFDAIIMKINGSGKIEWTKTFGDTKIDIARSIERTADGGYIVSGETWSQGNGYFDCWIFKLNSNGTLVWEKTFGGEKFERAFSVKEVSSQEILVAGYSNSNATRDKDFLLIKYSQTGQLLWSNTYGGASCDQATSIIQTIDGAILAAGASSSYGEGEIDSLLLKINK